MSDFGTYAADQVEFILAGIPVKGFAKGSFINAVRNTPSFTDVVGSAGDGSRAKSSDKSGTVTLTLLDTSKSNADLSALAERDELTNDGIGKLLSKDFSGATVIRAERAWLEMPAGREFAQENTSVEWVVKAHELFIRNGGN